MFDRLRRSSRGARGAVLALTLPLAASIAFAQAASFSGPSVAKVSETVTFRGSALPPNAAVTVLVAGPDGQTAGMGAVAQADGTLSYTFSSPRTGAHTLTLTDSGGRALASAAIVVLP